MYLICSLWEINRVNITNYKTDEKFISVVVATYVFAISNRRHTETEIIAARHCTV